MRTFPHAHVDVRSVMRSPASVVLSYIYLVMAALVAAIHFPETKGLS
jgi:hypothetical protein